MIGTHHLVYIVGLRCNANHAHKNSAEITAIQIAFQRSLWGCALLLLKAGSHFPLECSDETFGADVKVTPELGAFITSCRKFETQIKQGDLIQIQQAVTDEKLTTHFISLANHSAPYLAFFSEQYEIYAFLKSRGFKLLANEERELSDWRLALSPQERQKKNSLIGQAMIKLVPKGPFATTTYLLSRSRILQSNPSNFEYVGQLYQELATIPEILIILQVLEYSGNWLDIIFDFESDSIQEISPAHGDNVKGSCDFKAGRIFICAKVDRAELLGSLAHELTHQAMQFLYSNDCNPFSSSPEYELHVMPDNEPIPPATRGYFCFGCKSDSKQGVTVQFRLNPDEKLQNVAIDSPERFIKAISQLNANGAKHLTLTDKQVQELITFNGAHNPATPPALQTIIENVKQNNNVDLIITRVFARYSAKDWPAEIIVRVPHMLAKYGPIKGKELLIQQANSLLQFFTDTIQPACKKFIDDKFSLPDEKTHLDIDTRLTIADVKESQASAPSLPAIMPSNAAAQSHAPAGLPAPQQPTLPTSSSTPSSINGQERTYYRDCGIAWLLGGGIGYGARWLQSQKGKSPLESNLTSTTSTLLTLRSKL